MAHLDSCPGPGTATAAPPVAWPQYRRQRLSDA